MSNPDPSPATFARVSLTSRVLPAGFGGTDPGAARRIRNLVTRWLPAGAAVALALAAGGCALTRPVSDPTRFYLLSAPSVTGSAVAPAVVGDGWVVGLRRVEVADYLRGRPPAVRVGPHEVRYREEARWAEPLEAGVARALGGHLTGEGAAARVEFYPFRSDLIRDWELVVRIESCEGDLHGAVRLVATWTLSAAPGGRVPFAERTRQGRFVAEGLTWDGESVGTLAEAISAGLERLAAGIGEALPREWLQ